ncbi:equilibrative nucleoside transporter 1 isoform X1 [Sabethes cyaneus]|uniref:equilibrative nucleoside transporter 1 isoform X1 n=1 Tax=Sabethes cyaneus TaxID=53552 RepID=UPI00237E3CC3|nr:equilibrative nucleoside transporter 1 isoform X1 [Sabethes cyaneus]
MAANDNQTLLDNRKNGSISIVGGKGLGHEMEKTPFLPSEPVRLTPAWEENNLPNDELNFKGVTMERAKMELHPPRDKLLLVFLTLMIHGVGTLMPWNMFITAKSYFVDYKLSQNYTGVESEYGTYFLSYVGFASQIPNLLFNWLNIFMNLGGNLTKRIVYSILIEVIVFVVTVVLAMIDSSEWPGAFFWITMITVVILNMAGGIYQNTVYGMVAKLPFKYTGAVVLGSNISGTFASIIAILSSQFASSVRTAAIYYFITAMFVLLLCFDTYFALPLNKFYRYHEMLKEKEHETHKRAGINVDGRPPYWTIFKQAFPQLFNVFFVFFITLAVFPAVHSDVKRSDTDFPIGDDLFVSITCFLTFNVFAMLGSLTTSWITWPKPKYLVWPVILRVVFLPLFLFCNYRPLGIERVLPIYINSDWVYWGVAVVMAYSSGYLSSLGMMYTPQSVESQHAVTAGMFAAAMLITGIFTGILFSMVFPWVVQYNFLDWLH